jgi:hypothetical protein
MRGDSLKIEPDCIDSLMPCPAWNAPLKRSEPGVSRPMNRSGTVFARVGVAPAAMSAGSMPRRLLPLQG